MPINFFGTMGALKTALDPASQAAIKRLVDDYSLTDDTPVKVTVGDDVHDYTWLLGVGIAIAIGTGLYIAYRRYAVGRQE